MAMASRRIRLCLVSVRVRARLHMHTGEADLRQVNEGKTKIIYEIATAPTSVLIRSKDRITAFDGKRADVFEGKSSLSNMTSCRVFEYLTECGVCARARTCKPNVQVCVRTTSIVTARMNSSPIAVQWCQLSSYRVALPPARF
jgi:hypothetical protein